MQIEDDDSIWVEDDAGLQRSGPAVAPARRPRRRRATAQPARDWRRRRQPRRRSPRVRRRCGRRRQRHQLPRAGAVRAKSLTRIRDAACPAPRLRGRAVASRTRSRKRERGTRQSGRRSSGKTALRLRLRPRFTQAAAEDVAQQRRVVLVAGLIGRAVGVLIRSRRAAFCPGRSASS